MTFIGVEICPNVNHWQKRSVSQRFFMIKRCISKGYDLLVCEKLIKFSEKLTFRAP